MVHLTITNQLLLAFAQLRTTKLNFLQHLQLLYCESLGNLADLLAEFQQLLSLSSVLPRRTSGQDQVHGEPPWNSVTESFAKRNGWLPGCTARNILACRCFFAFLIVFSFLFQA